jgi:hypothetical protein
MIARKIYVPLIISLLLAIMVIVGAIKAVVSNVTTTANNMWAYAAPSSTNASTSITSQSFSLENIETKKARVSDIDIAYKIFV